MTFHLIAVVSLVVLLATSSIFAQPKAIEMKSPATVRDILEAFKAPFPFNEPAELNNDAIKMIQHHCDIGFVDDGTNYWVLRTAGANEALMREVERCTSPQRRREALEMTNKADELSVYTAKKILIKDLIHFLFPYKDIVGRMRTIAACKEHVLRYGETDRFGDPGTDELLNWIKATLPKMESAVSRMQEIH